MELGFSALQADSLASELPWKFKLPKWKWKSLSHAGLFATPWTIQFMELSRPEYWSGWPFPSLGDLPNPGINLNKIPLCLLGPNWSMANDCYKRVWETHSVSFERGGSKHTFNTYYMERSGTSTFIFLKISLTIVPQSPLLLPYHLCSLSELSW